MKIIILITSLFITSFSFAQSKTDIMSKGTKVGFKIHADCALAEKYTLEACTHIPEQRIFCHNIGEKTISEQTNCSGSDIKISLLTPSEDLRKKEGQGTYQKKVKFMDRFRVQQQQQQQESGRN
jgi:hypothetical protein